MEGQDFLRRDILEIDKRLGDKKKELVKIQKEYTDIQVEKIRLQKALDLWEGKAPRKYKKKGKEEKVIDKG